MNGSSQVRSVGDRVLILLTAFLLAVALWTEYLWRFYRGQSFRGDYPRDSGLGCSVWHQQFWADWGLLSERATTDWASDLANHSTSNLLSRLSLESVCPEIPQSHAVEQSHLLGRPDGISLRP
jgi:hypothetical protein